MNEHIKSARKYIPSAAAALLFTALLAQAPHAATVFIRIAPDDVHWEAWGLAILGGVVYAIALESATAYFVWRNKMRWAIAFAAFSIMHNVAYYMPGAWTFNIAGAELSLRYIVSALLISASLPIAIAAFSHVHVETIKSAETPQIAQERPQTPRSNDKAKNAPAPVALPVGTTGHQDANKSISSAPAETPEQPDQPQPDKLTKEQRRALIAEWQLQKAEQVMESFGVGKRTADGDLAWVRSNIMHTNGVASDLERYLPD
jgi:hypothetical protein